MTVTLASNTVRAESKVLGLVLKPKKGMKGKLTKKQTLDRGKWVLLGLQIHSGRAAKYSWAGCALHKGSTFTWQTSPIF